MTLKSKQSADFENINNKQNRPTMEIGKNQQTFLNVNNQVILKMQTFSKIS